MTDIPKEQPSPVEIARGEARLTPVQQAMNRVRAGILGPMERMDLPEEHKKIIYDYSDRASDVARGEFERLQKDSPAQRLVDALTGELRVAGDNIEQRRLIQAALATVQSQVKQWQDTVAAAQGLAAITGKTETLEQIVVEQIGIAKQKERHQNPLRPRGIEPNIGSLFTDRLEQGGDVQANMEKAVVAERVLKRLGFLAEGASVGSLFMLPEPPYKNYSDSELEDLRWGGKPVRVSRSKIAGLQSPSMPGVVAQVEHGGSYAAVWFSFKPEAVTRSVSTVAAVL